MKEATPGQPVVKLIRGKSSLPGKSEVLLLEGDATCEDITLVIPNDIQIPIARRFKQLPFLLKILHFNDLHGHFSHIGCDENVPVFSRIVSQIQKVRSTCLNNPLAGMLVFSGGDDMIGSPFDILLGNDLPSYQAHAGYYLYSKAGIDAAVIGNHDFDLGLDLLSKSIQTDAHFPILSANLKPAKQIEKLCYPAAIFNVKSVRVGVIGLTTAAETRSRPGSEYEIVDPIPVVKRLLPIVRSLSDVVIILSHLGYNMSSPSAAMAFAGDMELAQNLPYGSVDLIIGGHTHDPINESGLESKNIVNGIPITQAGCNGRFLGEVDLIIHNKPTEVKVALSCIKELPVDADFEEKHVQPLIESIRPQFDKVLGTVEDSQDLWADVRVNTGVTDESAIYNFVSDALVSCCRKRGLMVDLAVIDASILNDSLMPGKEFTYGDWMRVMPYVNTVVLFTLNGKQLIDLIRDNALRIHIPDEPSEERGFLHFSKEIHYRIKVKPFRSQIQATDIRFEGVPIENLIDRDYSIACTNFLRILSKRWEEQAKVKIPLLEFSPRHAQGLDTGLFVRDLLLDHILQYGGVNKSGGAKRDGRMVIIDDHPL